MDFQITEEEQSIRTMAQHFARDELLPRAKKCYAVDYFSTATLRKAASLGVGAYRYVMILVALILHA